MQVCPMRFDQQIIKERILWIRLFNLNTCKVIGFCLSLLLYFHIWIYSKKRVYPLCRITNDYSLTIMSCYRSLLLSLVPFFF